MGELPETVSLPSSGGREKLMGFHVCEYCREETSSGDVVLAFDSGRVWQVPELILHYVAKHGYQPHPDFIHDVMHSTMVECSRSQTKGALSPTREGYLSGWFPVGTVNEMFFLRLWQLMRLAEMKRTLHADFVKENSDGT
jgi:hypothetical protein